MIRLLMIPVWLFTKAVVPLYPAGHPWRARPMTLRSWVETGTPLAREFAVGFWLSGLGLASIAWTIWSSNRD